MTDLVALHKKVWDFRRAAQGKWPVPDPLNALRFAVTEMGEVMDAHLRESDRWVRNNTRETDVEAELADLTIMLLTSMPGELHPVNFAEENEIEDIDDLSCEVALSLVLMKMDAGLSAACALDCLRGIAFLLPSIDRKVDERLLRLAAKHGIDWQ